ncbi:MAG: 3-oxoacyl-[acyl-carrier protein] reductase [Flavobacteriales bacterium]|jgi:3-oxoacyl-[acyl-carrier protein] reductase
MKCALVTGGSRGLGRAISVALAKDLGYHILVNYQGNEAAAKETLAMINADGGTGECIQFDVSKKDKVDTALEAWAERNPEAILEVLVNNAGITRDNLMVWMEEEAWDAVINTHVKGMFNCTKFVIQKMVRKRYGRIINIVSVSGVKGVPGQTNYSAAKGAMIAATRSLAQEVAKRKITVNAIAPGFIESDMTDKLPKDQLMKLIPANRFGDPQEVADLVSFIASSKSAYITGEIININGGIHS